MGHLWDAIYKVERFCKDELNFDSSLVVAIFASFYEGCELSNKISLRFSLGPSLSLLLFPTMNNSVE